MESPSVVLFLLQLFSNDQLWEVIELVRMYGDDLVFQVDNLRLKPGGAPAVFGPLSAISVRNEYDAKLPGLVLGLALVMIKAIKEKLTKPDIRSLFINLGVPTSSVLDKIVQDILIPDDLWNKDASALQRAWLGIKSAMNRVTGAAPGTNLYLAGKGNASWLAELIGIGKAFAQFTELSELVDIGTQMLLPQTGDPYLSNDDEGTEMFQALAALAEIANGEHPITSIKEQGSLAFLLPLAKKIFSGAAGPGISNLVKSASRALRRKVKRNRTALTTTQRTSKSQGLDPMALEALKAADSAAQRGQKVTLQIGDSTLPLSANDVETLMKLAEGDAFSIVPPVDNDTEDLPDVTASFAQGDIEDMPREVNTYSSSDDNGADFEEGDLFELESTVRNIDDDVGNTYASLAE